MPTEQDKQKRRKRLIQISRAVATIENRLVVTPEGVRSDGFRALYYLARLAKKAK